MWLSPFKVGLSFGLMLSSLSYRCEGQNLSTGASSSVANKIESIENFQLISTSVGWILSEEGLFMTSDAGHSWVNRSPAEIPNSTIRSVRFADENTGWMLSTGDAGTFGNNLIVSKTVDRGVTWKNAEIGADDDLLREGFGGEASISFSDASTGWILIQRASGAAHSLGRLYATIDGGNSWVLQPDPPVAGILYFISSGKGWLKGGVHDNELYATSDGGRHWQKQQVPKPPKISNIQTISYRLPSFSDEGHGSMPVLFENQAKRRTIAVFATADGGVTWSQQQIYYDVPRSQKVFLSSSYGRSVVSLQLDGSLSLVGQVRQPLKPLSLPTELAPLISITKLQLIDESHGWMSATSGTCDREKDDCKTASSLLETADGGETFKIVFTHLVNIYPNVILKDRL